jgi:hypothetical protein
MEGYNMKSNLTESPFRQYSKLPKSWPARPRLINYDKADAAIHYEDGWRDVVFPDYDAALQRLGELTFDEANDHFTYAVIDKTPEELEAERLAMIPASITPTQGRILLKQMELLDDVTAMVENSNDPALQIYWEYSLSWDRYSPYVSSMANLLGMTEEDLENFYINASLIN